MLLDNWIVMPRGANLANHLGGEEIPVVCSVIRHLRLIGAVSYVLESHYIDRDYSADYLRFYAQTFRSHDRHCQRVHFFSANISEALEGALNPEPCNQATRYRESKLLWLLRYPTLG